MPDLGRVVTLPGRKGPAIDFYPDLTGRRRYLWSFYGKAFLDVDEAERVRQAICDAAKHQPLVQVIDQFRSPRARRDTVWEVCEGFFAAAPRLGSLRTGEPYTARTLAHYRAVLGRSRPRLERRTMADFFRPESLADFRAWFTAPPPEGRGLEDGTEASNALIVLRAVVRWYQLERPEFVVQWPSAPTKLTLARRARKRRERQQGRADARLTLPQVVQAIGTIAESRQPIYWAMFFTQARPSEARACLGVDWSRPRLRIARAAESGSSRATICDVNKTDADGCYTLPDWVADLIDRHCTAARFDPSEPLFQNPDTRAAGRLYSDDALRDVWMSALDRLGLPRVPLYRALKHTQVSALRDAGLPVDEIVDQCRWAGPAMLEHYDTARDERRERVVLRLAELAAAARREG